MSFPGVKKFNVNTSCWIGAIGLFVVLPLVYDQTLADAEMPVRLIGLSVGLAIAFAFFSWKNVSIDRKIFTSPISVLLGLLFAWRAVSGNFSFDAGESFYLLLRDGTCVILFFVFIIAFKHSHDAQLIFSKGICIAILIFSSLGIIQLWPELQTAWWESKPLIARSTHGATLVNKNFFAETMVLFLPFAAFVCLQRSVVWRSIGITAVISCLTLIWLLQSGAVWLAFVVEIGVIGFFVLRERIGFFRTSLSIAAMFLAMTVGYMFTDSYRTNLQKVKYSINALNTKNAKFQNEKLVYNSYTERLLMWQHTIRMVNDRPLLGVGTANWKTVLPRYGTYGLSFMDSGKLRLEHPHNEFLFTFAENGLVGLLLLVALLVACGIRLLTLAKRSTRDGSFAINCAAALGGLIVISFFSYPLQRFYPVVIFMLVLSYAATSQPMNENTSSYRMRGMYISIVLLCMLATYFFNERIKSERHFQRTLVAQQQRNWPAMHAHAVAAQSSVMASDLLATPLQWYAGFAKFYGGDAQGAEPFFLSASRINPYHLQNWNDLGTCYERRHAYSEATNCYIQAITINSTYSPAMLNLTATYFNAGYLDSAYAVISKHPRNYNQTQYRSFLLAVLKSKLEDMIAAETDLNRREQLSLILDDDKQLIETFERSHQTGKKIESVYLEMIN